jgi:hypothetical protein
MFVRKKKSRTEATVFTEGRTDMEAILLSVRVLFELKSVDGRSVA